MEGRAEPGGRVVTARTRNDRGPRGQRRSPPPACPQEVSPAGEFRCSTPATPRPSPARSTPRRPSAARDREAPVERRPHKPVPVTHFDRCAGHRVIVRTRDVIPGVDGDRAIRNDRASYSPTRTTGSPGAVAGHPGLDCRSSAYTIPAVRDGSGHRLCSQPCPSCTAASVTGSWSTSTRGRIARSRSVRRPWSSSTPTPSSRRSASARPGARRHDGRGRRARRDHPGGLFYSTTTIRQELERLGGGWPERAAEPKWHTARASSIHSATTNQYRDEASLAAGPRRTRPPTRCSRVPARRRHPRPHRDVAKLVDRQHDPPDPPPRGHRRDRAAFPSADRHRDAR